MPDAGIREILARRRISRLVHFTSAKNLISIEETGFLYSVDDLEEMGIRFGRNDYRRAEGHRDAICLSISFPNYLMFYRYRQIYQKMTWVIIELSPTVLLNHRCAFFPRNASEYCYRHQDPTRFQTAKALEEMFTEVDPISGNTRAALGLKPWEPTNPQAEVLCFEPIPVYMIKTVYFETEQRLLGFIDRYGDAHLFELEVDKTFFAPRHDWRSWSRSSQKHDKEQLSDLAKLIKNLLKG